MTVKVGDKVRCLVADNDVALGREYEVAKIYRNNGSVGVIDDVGDTYYLFARAYEPITEEPATPKAWKHMTAEEMAPILLAWAAGEVIERWHKCSPEWTRTDMSPTDWGNNTYRIKPAEPKVEEVVLAEMFAGNGIWEVKSDDDYKNDTHRITFNTIDGKPDCASIKMEEL